MKYTILFKYSGEDKNIERDFNIDMINLSCDMSYDDINEFQQHVNLINDISMFNLNDKSFFIKERSTYMVDFCIIHEVTLSYYSIEENRTPIHSGYRTSTIKGRTEDLNIKNFINNE